MPNLLRFLMMQARLMAPDDGGGGGGGGSPSPSPAPAPAPSPSPAPAPSPSPAPRAGNPFLDLPLEDIPDQWREHARELRRENASLREKTKAIDDATAQAKIDDAVKKAVEAQQAETKAILEAERTASNRRIINSEVKAIGLSMGLQDPDALKLIDTSKLTVDAETGEVAGVAELLEAFKTAKPYLFKEPASSTSHTGNPPPKKQPETFDARKATPEETKAKAKELGIKIKM